MYVTCMYYIIFFQILKSHLKKYLKNIYLSKIYIYLKKCHFLKINYINYVYIFISMKYQIK